MDGGDYSEGITKTPIVIDNVSIFGKLTPIRDLELSKLASVEKKSLLSSLTHSKYH